MEAELYQMPSEPCKIRISNLPLNFDMDHLCMIVKRCAKVENVIDFKVELQDDSTAIVTFKGDISEQGMHIFIYTDVFTMNYFAFQDFRLL